MPAILLTCVSNVFRGTRNALRDALIDQLRSRYATIEFERIRQQLDPKKILANPTIESIFVDQDTGI